MKELFEELIRESNKVKDEQEEECNEEDLEYLES